MTDEGPAGQTSVFVPASVLIVALIQIVVWATMDSATWLKVAFVILGVCIAGAALVQLVRALRQRRRSSRPHEYPGSVPGLNRPSPGRSIDRGWGCCTNW